MRAISSASELGRGERFSAEVGALTAAFGDPTRRSIFLHVTEHPSCSVRDVAEAFGIHTNVARHHLERLVAGGHLEIAIPRNHGNTGRPAKRYSVSATDHSLEITTRLDDLLVALLKGALTALGPEQAENLAQDIGEEYGRDLATKMSPADGTRSVSAAMQAIAATLTAHGFAAHAEEVDGGTSVVSDHCPFGTAALEFPVLCAVDRGMINGMLSGLSGSRRRLGSVMLSSKARGDLSCQATA